MIFIRFFKYSIANRRVYTRLFARYNEIISARRDPGVAINTPGFFLSKADMEEFIEFALQSQFNTERYNQSVYMAASDMLEWSNWPGCAHFMRAAAADELKHSRKFAGFLIDMNKLPKHYELLAPKIDPEADFPQSPFSLFRAALDLEKNTTANISQLFHLAAQAEDPTTHQFLLWFVREQRKSERQLLDMIRELVRAGIDQAALLKLDHKYGKL